MSKRQPFAVGPFTITFSGDARAVAAFDELFSGFDRSADGQGMAVHLDRSGDQMTALIDTKVVAHATSLAELCLAVTRVINRRVLDAEPSLLHLHAGAATKGTNVTLVVGPSMAGKSTVVATLLTRGWRYMSDEQLAVHADGTLVPYPRPITLRRPSWQLFASVIAHTDGLAASVDRAEVPPTVLGAVHAKGPVAPTLVISPSVGTEVSAVERLSSAEAMALMVSDSLDLERAGQPGIVAMAAIAGGAAAYRVTAPDSEGVCQHIDQLAQTSHNVSPITAHEIVRASEQSTRVAGTCGWLFGDGSAAIYEPRAGLLAVVDERGFQVWSALGSVPSKPGVAERNAHFERELQVAGLLHAARA